VSRMITLNNPILNQQWWGWRYPELFVTGNLVWNVQQRLMLIEVTSLQTVTAYTELPESPRRMIQNLSLDLTIS
jgi:hypothetical protein